MSMLNHINLSQVASTIADPSRAAILMTLMDGRMHSASELAYMTRITPQTASFHLAKMLNLGLIVMEKQGRHRYYKLDSSVASFIEQLMQITPPAEVRSLRESTEMKRVKHARTCYDHFAGEFGVALTESMLRLGILMDGDSEFKLTQEGINFFSALGIDLDVLKKRKRKFSIKCLDWSERKYHLAGALGHSLVERFHELMWTETVDRSRAIKITDNGRLALKERFQIDLM